MGHLLVTSGHRTAFLGPAAGFQLNHRQLAVAFPSAPAGGLPLRERMGARYELFGGDLASSQHVSADLGPLRIEVRIDGVLHHAGMHAQAYVVLPDAQTDFPPVRCADGSAPQPEVMTLQEGVQ
jgi:hypothetical protein